MKLTTVLGTVLVVVFLCVAVFAIYFTTALPTTMEVPKLKVEGTPEQVERGKYLAHHVAVCMDCHSSRDWSRFSGPLVPGSLGKGGEAFTAELGFPGNFYAPNLTPYHLGDWTDGEIYRAITNGISADGRALFPVMPYHSYGQMADEDVFAIIAYLRTLPEQKNDVPASIPDFPFNFIIKTMPRLPHPAPLVPPKSDQVAYGAYLFTAASCGDCHTPYEKGRYDMTLANAGGREFILPGGILRSPNITPHASGIGNWTEEQFVQKFRVYADSSYRPPILAQGDFQTIMPWTMYGSMTEEDLKAIYAYLRQLQPVDHAVERFTPL